MAYKIYNLSEPCQPTCPKINKVIRSIDDALDILRCVVSDDDAVTGTIENAINELVGLEDQLEDIRSDNSDLREWGGELADVVRSIQEIL